MENTPFKVQVISPAGTLYSGEVTALSGTNEKGNFDILYYHMNFISIIQGKITLHEKGGTSKKIDIGQAIIKSYENVVYVFVGIPDINIDEANPSSVVAPVTAPTVRAG